MDAFVHASGDGFGNTAPLRSDTGAIDMDAISQVAHVTQGAGKLTRKEKKHAKREMKRRKKEAKKAEKEAKKTYSSIKSQLKDRDKELSDKMADARKKRDSAKDVVNYIGYNKMYQDGICEVEEGMFSSSIAFDDTSYHSVRDEQQKAMFSAITRLYDQFGADTLVQMSVINTPLLREEVGHRKFFDPERQANDAARNDAQVFNNILNDKVKEGVSNIRRNRYLTYSVTADTAEDAARQLSRIEVESSRILNSIGSKAHLMNGTQRLSVIHSLLNPYKPFLFDYQRDISAKRLQTTKDCIAPTQIDFRPDGHYNDCVKLDNGVYAQVLVMKKFGSELSDRALADMADLPIPMAITWYVQPMDKSKAINYVRTRSAWIDKEIIEEQRSAVNKGYDFSILPQELKYSKEETEDVLDHLQNKNQRLYVFTGLVYTYAESKEALDTQVLRIISTARQNSIELDTYDYRQRQGLNSILPLGHNHVEISRMFTTAQVSILVPFATQELDDAGGNFYGQNKHSRNLVVCNRKKLTSPMGFVCGKTGSGKGMFTKTEMTGTIFSNPTDEIYVIDRAGEYTAIAERYGGSTYHFGVGTGTHLNPFDTVSVEHMTRNEQIAFKVDAMLAQAGASAAEAGSNFSEVDQSLVQRCTELAFQKAAERGDNLPPTLQDFYDAANEQPEEQAQVIALRYERFVKGSMNFFNHQSNVDFNTRIVDFNLKDLPDSMLVFALINVCEAVRNRMYFNAKRNVRTWLYVEEIDATSTLPAVKDIVFLVVTYCILSYFIDNALDLVSAIYGIFNDLVGNVSDKLQSKNWYEPGIEMTKDDATDATFGGCFLLLIFGLISWVVGLVFYAISMVVALGRSVQLYVYAAFSPIPISLLGFEETKQIGIGYLKNFAAAALAGVVMVLILYLYPHLVTALAVSGGLGKAEMLGLAQGVETFDSFGVIIKTIAVLITTMMGLVKSGSWAKEILGA